MSTQKPIQISLKEINPPIIHSHKFEPTAIKYLLELLNFNYYPSTNNYIKEMKSEMTISSNSLNLSIPIDIEMVYNDKKRKEPFKIYYNGKLLICTNDAELFISEAFNLTEHEN